MSLSVDSTYAQFNITSTTVKISKGKTTFLHGFISALTLVFLSEFGDRTFFLTAILSINHSRITTFIAALTALLLNSILACGFGVLASNVPKVYIHYLSIVLFTAFGLKTIYDAYYMPAHNEEYYSIQTTYRNPSQNTNGVNNEIRGANESQPTSNKEVDETHPQSRNKSDKGFLSQLKRFWSSFFLSTFLIILVAELGDRSQVSVLVLAAQENFFGVALGAFIAQFVSTSIAVIAGHFVGEKVSVRIVTFIAGILFLVFALVAAVKGVPSNHDAD